MLEDSVEELTMKHNSVLLPNTSLSGLDEAFEVYEAPERTGSNESMSLTTSPTLPIEADKPELKKKAKKQQKQAVPPPPKPALNRDPHNQYQNREQFSPVWLP